MNCKIKEEKGVGIKMALKLYGWDVATSHPLAQDHVQWWALVFSGIEP
jgi:hypothetical protein